MNSKDANTKYERNYQLDCVKCLFTAFVVLSHTWYFIGENTRITLPLGLGFVSVHFFFIVSGMLMVNSFMKHESSLPAGKQTTDFIVKKFKSIALYYIIALIIKSLITVILNGISFDTIYSVFVRIIPEMFGVQMAGASQIINGPTWYISAMLICMIPLYYILVKNKDFFLRVFAPFAALISFGYMANQADARLVLSTFYGFATGALIRAFCGLCFGAVAFVIYQWLANNVKKRAQRIIATITEILFYILIISVTLTPKQWVIREYAVMYLMPIAVAITFSGKSYLAELFKFKWLKNIGNIAFLVYLNHVSAIFLIDHYFKNISYKKGVAYSAILTVILCVFSYYFAKLVRYIWSKKLKQVFSNSDDSEAKS